MGKLNLLINICLFICFLIVYSLLGINTPILCSFPAPFVCNFQINILQTLFFLAAVIVVNILQFLLYLQSEYNIRNFLFWTSCLLSIFLLSYRFSFSTLHHVYVVALTNVSQINLPALKTDISSSKKIFMF